MSASDWVKRTAGWIATGMYRCRRRAATMELAILLYHRVTPEVRGVAAPSDNVTPFQLHRQLKGLQEQGCHFLSLSDAIDLSVAGAPWPQRSVVVTFDDGFGNVYHHAWPVLKDLGIPATVFLCTAFLDQEHPFPFDIWGRQHARVVDPLAWKPLSRGQCKEMLDSGLVKLGAHTHTHRDFRHQSEIFRQDMEACLHELKTSFGIDRPLFAFPYGRVAWGFAGGVLTEVARQLPLRCALTTECHCNGLGSDPFQWGRFNAYDWDTPATIAAKIAGCYGWMPRLQELSRNWFRWGKPAS